MKINWYNSTDINSKDYTCGYCHNLVASNKGYKDNQSKQFRIYICPHCSCPSYFDYAKQTPNIALGNHVNSVPEDIAKLYEEARYCCSTNSYTAAVLTCRKLLMNIAVSQGAEENKNFMFYVEYLSEKGFVPPNGKHWVDHIRKKGNEANHEIHLMDEKDAEELIIFIEMLLKFIYEFPAKVPSEEVDN